MFGHRLDHVEHAANAPAFFSQCTHRCAGQLHLGRQVLEARNRAFGDVAATDSILRRLVDRARGFDRVAGHILHRGGHFVHGRSHLLGFLHLLGSACLRLPGNRRQLFAGAGDLRRTITDMPNQLSQAAGHVLQAILQLADFVFARARGEDAQVALGNAPHPGQRFAQGWHDLPRDQHCCQPAQQQRQHQATDQRPRRITGIVLAHLHLLVVQLLAGLQQCITLLLDVLEQGVDADQRRAVSVQRGPVGGRNEMNANGQLGAPSRR